MTFQEQLDHLIIEKQAIPEAFALPELINQRSYLSDGELVTWDGPTHEVFSPICMHTPDGVQRIKIGSYPVCTEKEAKIALDAACKAYNDGRGEWPTMSVAQRINCVEQFVVKMLAQKEIVVKLIMWEIGKTYADSEKEFDRTVEYIYATIEALKDIDRDSSRFTIEQGIVAQIRRSPLGVVLCMGPFNYPLNETFTTLIPAIIMGNTLLFKAPKHGTLLHYPMLEAFKSCFPKGVVNTIYGRGNVIIPALMESGKINVLTLIGSSKVANQLKKLHPKVNRLRAILGLDAKNAAIITKDADIKLAVQETVLGSLSFNGQRCTALKTIFVHQSIAKEFIELLKEQVAKLQFGLPWEKGVTLTALPEPGKPAYLNDLIEDAKLHGAAVMNENGGTMKETFFYPAILFPVNHKMKIYTEEQFGPIVPVAVYSDVSQVIEYFKTTIYGQQAAIFTKDADSAAPLVDILGSTVGRININTQCSRGPDVLPFSGRRSSSLGTLSIDGGLSMFSIATVIAGKDNEVNRAVLDNLKNSSKFMK